MAVKSPAKNAVYDWEASIFNSVKNQDQYKRALRSLEQLSFSIHDWAKILFNRSDDDLFYGLLIEIWNEA